MKKQLSINGFVIEIEVTGRQNVFCLKGKAKRAGRLMATDMITGEMAGNWKGLFVPFSDTTVKMAEDTLIKKLSIEANQAIRKFA